MKKLLKIILYVFAILLLLVFILTLVLPFIIDPNDFKPKIEAQVKAKTGRSLSIDGELKLSVFPWLGFSTGHIALSNAPGFSEQNFAEIEASAIKVKLIPLFSKDIQVSRVTLKGLSLNLQKNKQGISNWADLAAGTDSQQESSSSATALAAIAIGGISIVDAELVWDDQQTGKIQHIHSFNLETDKVVFNQPIATELSFVLMDKKAALTHQIALSSQLLIDEGLQKFTMQDLQLDTDTKGEAIPAGQLSVHLKTDVALNLAEQTIKLNKLQISSGDLIINAELQGEQIQQDPRINGTFDVVEFNPRALMQQLTLDMPPMQDPTALSRLSMQFNLFSTTKQARMNDLVINLDDTIVKGAVDVKDFAQPKLDFNFRLDRIDADRYLAPANENTATPIQDKQTTPMTAPAIAAAKAVEIFPIATLKKLNINGDVRIDQMTIKKLLLKSIKLQLNAKDGIINTQQKVQKLYQGNYSGKMNIDVNKILPTVSLNERLVGVKLAPLLTDLKGQAKMTGTVNASAKLHMQGNTQQALKSTLNGTMDFQFNDGVIKGFNLQEIVRNTLQVFNKQGQALDTLKNQTEFTEITAHVQAKNGLLSNDDLLAKSSVLRVNGKGTANLITTQLDYKVTAKALRKEASTENAEKIHLIPVVIDVYGSFDQPGYKPNISEMIPEKDKQKILDKVEKKLGKKASSFLKKLF